MTIQSVSLCSNHVGLSTDHIKHSCDKKEINYSVKNDMRTEKRNEFDELNAFINNKMHTVS